MKGKEERETRAVEAEQDEVEKRIRSTGCWDAHLEVADCMERNDRDWRKCQEEVSPTSLFGIPNSILLQVRKFKECINLQAKRKSGEEGVDVEATSNNQRATR